MTYLIKIFLTTLLILFFSCENNSKSDLPNIILIIGDDHGYPYFGFMGADYVKTPNMDQLASSGTLFKNGYVPDNHCRPSLATLVTGMLPIKYNREVEQMILDKAKIEENHEHVGFPPVDLFGKQRHNISNRQTLL